MFMEEIERYHPVVEKMEKRKANFKYVGMVGCTVAL